ncbi:MAG TPA: hypothetical protein VF070_27075 [Streptosporangiaceae bacterium]
MADSSPEGLTMVCYARGAFGMMAVAIAVLVIFGRAIAHYLDVAALLTAILIVVAGTAMAATAAYVSFRSIRRRRALAGGCVGCQFRCQHAMTDFAPGRAGAGGPTRLWLISSVDRGAPTPSPTRSRAVPATIGSRAVPGASGSRLTPAAPRPGGFVPAPRWPDRPLHADPPPAEQRKVRVPAGAR